MSAVVADVRVQRERPWDVEPSKLLLADLNHLLLWAKDVGASDLDLLSDEPPLARIDGEFMRVASRRLTTPELAECLNEIRGAANASALLLGGDDLDFSYGIQRSRDVRVSFRVNATSTQTEYSATGINLTFRTIPEVPPTMDELGIEPDLVALHRDVAASQGLLLVVGATGTGKTTLLASLMRDVLESRPGRKIVTFESPIEFNLSAVPKKIGAVSQCEIGKHIQSFQRSTRNVLRRAPNVILVGESRDIETVRATVIYSSTGHAVYTTVHASSVADALPRMVREFPESDQAAILYGLIAEVRGIVTQRLVPKVGGGRVALREFLRFTHDIRLHLANVPRNQIQPECQRLVERQGQSLLADARRKHGEGLIGDETLALVAAEWASSAESVALEAQAA